MKATGIPPNLAIAHRVLLLEESVEKVRRLQIDNHTEINTLLPAAIVTEIRQHVVVEGMQPLSLTDLNRVLDERMNQMLDRINTLGNIQRNAGPVEVNNNNNINNNIGGYPTYNWGGRLHPCPPNYTIPRYVLLKRNELKIMMYKKHTYWS